MPPGWMIDVGKQAGEFFEPRRDSETGQRKTYRLKSIEQYSREHNTQEQPSKKYFKGTLLPEIIQSYDRDKGSSSSSKAENQANGIHFRNQVDRRTTNTNVFH
jgi:dual specificity protein kinase YAK1